MKIIRSRAQGTIKTPRDASRADRVGQRVCRGVGRLVAVSILQNRGRGGSQAADGRVDSLACCCFGGGTGLRSPVGLLLRCLGMSRQKWSLADVNESSGQIARHASSQRRKGLVTGRGVRRLRLEGCQWFACARCVRSRRPSCNRSRLRGGGLHCSGTGTGTGKALTGLALALAGGLAGRSKSLLGGTLQPEARLFEQRFNLSAASPREGYRYCRSQQLRRRIPIKRLACRALAAAHSACTSHRVNSCLCT